MSKDPQKNLDIYKINFFRFHFFSTIFLFLFFSKKKSNQLIMSANTTNIYIVASFSAVVLGVFYYFLPDVFPVMVAVVGGSWFKHLYLDKKQSILSFYNLI